MLQIVTILGWLIACGLLVHLAMQAIRHRFHGRRRRSLAARNLREFKKHHHFDAKRQRWVRNLDDIVVVDEAREDRRLLLTLLGWLLLLLWEGYWIYEIVERFSNAARPLQLPYMFLFFMLVVIPLTIYSFARRRMRRRLTIG
jgi:hypothetical protein